MSSSTFRNFLTLGAGVTPAQGSVKPTAGFTLKLTFLNFCIIIYAHRMPETFQKESALDRFFNRLMGRALKLGFAPAYMRLLEVRGRKSGKTFTTPVNVLDFNGRRWLVAARGETAWARNARAAGHVVLRRGASTESLMVRELADADKPEVIKAFLDRFASQVQRFFDVPAGSPVDAFRATASRTPVFELMAGS